jgi:hypothetical protein
MKIPLAQKVIRQNFIKELRNKVTFKIIKIFRNLLMIWIIKKIKIPFN